ncbi:MAG: DUF6089 family protein [Bacteroidales bacterium]
MKSKILKKVSLAALLLHSLSGYGQEESIDLGVFMGKSSYFGNLTSVRHFESIAPNTFGAFLRNNFNKRFAYRLSYNHTGLDVSGKFHGLRYSFAKNINDINLSAEVNYLKFMPGKGGNKWTSYIGLGMGFLLYDYYYDPKMLTQLTPHPDYIAMGRYYTKNKAPLYIPITFGVKAELNSRFSVGAEIIVKKIFASTLDDLSNPIGFAGASSMHNNDMIPTFGIHISYKLIIFANDCYGLD